MEPYKYSPLKAGQGEIRLIKLLPGSNTLDTEIEIYHAKASSNPKYEALSYVWGPPERSDIVTIHLSVRTWFFRKPKVVQISQLKITNNLAVALRHLRYTDRERVLWIDAICINQDDLTERSTEVLKMGDIYSKAENVVVWLGPSSHDSSLGIETLSKISQNVVVNVAKAHGSTQMGSWAHQLEIDGSAVKATSDNWIAVKSLIGRKYFSRLWVFQEIGLATKAKVYVGEASLDWDSFLRGLQWVRANVNRLNNVVDGLALEDHLGNRIAGFTHLSDRHYTNIMTNLERSKSLACYDPRDRLFAIRALVDPAGQESIKPDYSKSIEDTYETFTKDYIGKSGWLDILSRCSLQRSALKLPSWVPDLSVPNISSTISWFYRASGNFKPQWTLKQDKVLEVQGVQITQIIHVTQTIVLPKTNLEILQRAFAWGGPGLTSNSKYPPDSFFEALLVGYCEGHIPSSSHPFTIEECRAAFDLLSDLSSPHNRNKRLALMCSKLRTGLEGRSMFYTTNGVFGVGPKLMLRGDIVVVVLGCGNPLVLRPAPEMKGYYRIVGECYVPRFANSEALLGPLPVGWRVKALENVRRQPLHCYTDSKIITQRDPRVELPSDWAYRYGGWEEALEKETENEEEMTIQWYENLKTGEKTDKHPSLTSGFLTERGVKVEAFDLI